MTRPGWIGCTLLLAGPACWGIAGEVSATSWCIAWIAWGMSLALFGVISLGDSWPAPN